MSRRLRLEFPGALYHVTSRGNARQAIFLDDGDREHFLSRLAGEVDVSGWRCHAYCLMGNHYHLLLETPEANLARGMRRLNSAYAGAFNRRHGRVGHLFQGRYHAILVEKETYLLEVARYIVLNPVRAGLASRAEEWPWSSYRVTVGIAGTDSVPVTTAELLGIFSQRSNETARAGYRAFVEEGVRRNPMADVHGGAWLGTAAFRSRLSTQIPECPHADIPLAQRPPGRPTADRILAPVLEAHGLTEAQLWAREDPAAFRAAVYLLRRVGGLTVRAVASRGGAPASRIAAIVRRVEERGEGEGLRSMLEREPDHPPAPIRPVPATE